MTRRLIASRDLENVETTGNSPMSIKEAVHVATNNNFMGITCHTSILKSVPALIEAIKEAGLVLIADGSPEAVEEGQRPLRSDDMSTGHGDTLNSPGLLEGIDGILWRTGLLHFQQRLEV